VRGALLLCLAALGLAGCPAPQHAVPAPAAPAVPPLRVAIARIGPPYAFVQGGQLVGLEVDFAHELAAALGRPLELVETAWEELIPVVRAHRADVVMSGMTITRARQVQLAFADPYLRSGLLAVMRSEDAARFRSATDVLATNEPIGVVGGTTAEKFVREHARTPGLMVYPDTWAALDELRQRRVRLVVHDAPVAIWFAAADEANLAVLLQLLDEEQLGWGFARDDEALRDQATAVLARWRTDGTRDAILTRWVPYWKRLEARPVGR